jgi:hypothetical protein
LAVSDLRCHSPASYVGTERTQDRPWAALSRTSILVVEAWIAIACEHVATNTEMEESMKLFIQRSG